MMFVHPSWRQIEVSESRDDGEHTGRIEAEPFEFLPVVFGVAERQRRARDVRGQLAAAAKAQLDEVLVDAEKVLGRRDVVVDEDHPSGQGVGRARRP
jgi:hypothetical protein